MGDSSRGGLFSPSPAELTIHYQRAIEAAHAELARITHLYAEHMAIYGNVTIRITDEEMAHMNARKKEPARPKFKAPVIDYSIEVLSCN